MKKGKIPESVLKRSVLKYIDDSKQGEMTKGAGPGEDCAFFWWDKDEKGLALSTQTVTLPVKEAPRLAVTAAANNLAAGGAAAFAATLAITLPFGEEKEALETDRFRQEKELKELMEQAALTCRELDIQIAGGHTEISDSVKSPVITVTAIGKPLIKTEAEEGKPPGLSIVMTKWAGLEGTVILAREKEEELLKRYPLSLIRTAQGLSRHLSLIPEAATALLSGVHTMHDARNGGVFGGLWELAERLGTGLSVDLKKIPVKQETIEICEYYDLNPYELLAGGSLLIAARDGEKLVEELQKEGIPAAVIGETTDSHDRVIINEEETRFLGPAGPDEIFKTVWN